ncbi:MAG: bifunctional glutamate N-acetyltransferase/amino-acid acetyltransferase ArgJ [Synoicihabitans sp.]
MTVSIIALDQPSPDFAAVFTRNAFPGAPVLIGRERLDAPTLGALVINNKISNVCAPEGIAHAEQVCETVAEQLGLDASQVLPSSTGVIGWQIPVSEMQAVVPTITAQLSTDSILPIAEGIMTTDLYPKVRRWTSGSGSIVGIAKGAGMVEPNMATMLVFILTDIAIDRSVLRKMLKEVTDETFNRISIDSDTSTSDTVALVSSGKVAGIDPAEFKAGLRQICGDLAEDVVRNGEGVRHVLSVSVSGAPSAKMATSLGRAVVNAPLFKCAVAGNDPNVGRLVQAIGRHLGNNNPDMDTASMQLSIGGIPIFSQGVFQLTPEKESQLHEHLRGAQLYASSPSEKGVFLPPVNYPTHENCVEIGIDLGIGSAGAVVLGGDLTHEYVTENADYRS